MSFALSVTIELLRTIEPVQLAAQVKLLAEAVGVSRVTDITRMDRLGLPVFISIRPRGRLLHVHAGKGLTPDAARVGALMEAIEHAAIERASDAGPDEVLTARQLASQLPSGTWLADFAPVIQSPPRSETPIPVLWFDNLSTAGRVPVPADLVLLRASDDVHDRCFDWTGGGFAAGATREEAALHGTMEVLERDAVMLHRARDESSSVPVASLPEPFLSWARDWAQLGVELLVRYLPHVSGLPCFQAVLHEAASSDVNLAGGYGLHFDRQVALTRAIAEAAQSRAGTIHGGRDDLPAYYAKYGVPMADHTAADTALVNQLRCERRQLPFSHTPSIQTSGLSAETALTALVRRLASVGFGAVLCHTLRLPDGLPNRDNVVVVKMVVPGCEFIPASSRVSAGPRLLARLLGRQGVGHA